MLLGRVTVMTKSPLAAPLCIGICSGRPSVWPNSVAELLSGLAQATANVTRVPGVTLDGTTEATVSPGELAVAASAGAEVTTAVMPRPAAPEAARPILSQN